MRGHFFLRLVHRRSKCIEFASLTFFTQSSQRCRERRKVREKSQEIFCYEWNKTGIPFTRQQPIPVIHEMIKMDVGFRSDVIIDKKLLIDFKSVESVHPVHKKRLKTYLRLCDIKLGLLLNFDVILFKDGIYRIVNGLDEDPSYVRKTIRI